MNLLDFPDEILLEIFSHCGGDFSNAIVTSKKLYSLKEDILYTILKQCFDFPRSDYVARTKLIRHRRERDPNNNYEIINLMILTSIKCM